MRVKLSVWKPCVKTLLIELLPWALLNNQSKWDLWLFEGEKIVLQIPAGKTIIPPNFQVDILFKLTCTSFLNIQTLFQDCISIHMVHTFLLHSSPYVYQQYGYDPGINISWNLPCWLDKINRCSPRHFGRIWCNTVIDKLRLLHNMAHRCPWKNLLWEYRADLAC